MMKIMGMKDLWKRFKATFALVDNPELMHPHGSSTSWRQEFHKGVSCVQNRTASQSEGCHHIVAVYSMYSIAMIIKAAKQEEKKTTSTTAAAFQHNTTDLTNDEKC